MLPGTQAHPCQRSHCAATANTGQHMSTVSTCCAGIKLRNDHLKVENSNSVSHTRFMKQLKQSRH